MSTTVAYKTAGVSAPVYASPNGGISRVPFQQTGAAPGVTQVLQPNATPNQPYKFMPLLDAGAAQYVPQRFQATPKFALTGPGTVNQKVLRTVDPTTPVFLGAFNMMRQKILVQGMAGVPAQYPVMQPLYAVPKAGGPVV